MPGRALRRSSPGISDGRPARPDLGPHRPTVQLQRHVSTRDQHLDHDRDLPDGLPDSAYSLAVQLKLAELIMAATGAENRLATAEDLSEEELEDLHKDYQRRAEDTLDRLK